MAMPDLARRYTVEEVLALPNDGNRYEVVQGELLVTPAPRWTHQVVVGRLIHALKTHLEPIGLADAVLMAPADITWGIRPKDADELVQPDIFVVHPNDAARNWLDVKHLILVAEVVSPSSTRGDRVVKRKAYQRHAVQTYWVVDPDAGLVEVWNPEDERPAIVTDVLRWRWAESPGELRIAIQDLFAPPRFGNP